MPFTLKNPTEYTYLQMIPYYGDMYDDYKSLREYYSDELFEDYKSSIEGSSDEDKFINFINFEIEDSSLFGHYDMEQAIAIIGFMLFAMKNDFIFKNLIDEAYWTIDALKTGNFDELFTDEDLVYLKQDIAAIEEWFCGHPEYKPKEQRVYSRMVTRGNHVFPFNTYLVGTEHIQGFDKIKLRVGDKLILCREKDNKYDSCAVSVYTYKQEKLGYINRNRNDTLAFWMDKGKYAYAEIVKIEDWHTPKKVKVALYVDIESKKNSPRPQEVVSSKPIKKEAIEQLSLW